MRFWICLILIFASLWLAAQAPNTLIMGTIKNAILEDIGLEINKRYIDNTIIEHSAKVDERGKYAFLCSIELPQIITLKYNDERMDLFIEPNDTLVINFSKFSFPHSVEFSGRSASNNELWRIFRVNFPRDNNMFKYRQYRKGIYYYQVHERFDSLMRAKDPEAFSVWLRREELRRRGFVDLYLQREESRITKGFLDFIEGEIIYDRLFKHLAYGHIYKGRYRLEDTFLGFMDSLDMQNDQALGNPQYRDFMMASVNYWCGKNPVPRDSAYIQQYYFSKKRFVGLTRYFMMAHILEKALRKQSDKVEILLPIYEDFIKNNPYRELDRLVVDAFQKARQFQVGTPAPTFNLRDMDGKVVNLRDFVGKVIYIDFWASWCRPCLKKMHSLKSIEQAFAERNIVFLHISLDRDSELWKNSVNTNEFKGIHLINDPTSSLTTDYQVLSVPKFFIITKEGNFAYTPTSSDESVLVEALEGLLRR